MNKEKRALIKTYKEMAPAVFVAMIATGLGFLALYTSNVPMIADFGKMLTIGIVVSFIIALLFLLPLIFIRDQHFPKEKSNKSLGKKENKLLYKFTMKILKIRHIIIFLAIGLAVVGIIFDQKVRVETDIETFMPQDSEALKDINELRERLGSTEQLAIVFKSDNIISEQNLSMIQTEVGYLQGLHSEDIIDTKSLLSLAQMMDYEITEMNLRTLVNTLPKDQTKVWINEDETELVVQLMIRKMDTKDLEIFIDDIREYLSEQETEEMTIVLTGQSVINVSMITSLTSGRYTITLLGMLAVFLGLLIIYRNPLKAITPLIPITLIIGWSGLIMYSLDIAYTPLTATLGAMIIGIGTEFTILIMDRFYKMKAETYNVKQSISEAVNTIGKPILISAITTIGGFSALIISDFEILKNFGIMTVINLSLAIISTLMIMPIVLYYQSKLRLKIVNKNS